MIRGTPEGDIYQDVITAHRTPRDTPREDILNLQVMFDPAPDWVCEIVRCVLANTRSEPPASRRALVDCTLAWCKLGSPKKRSRRLCSFIASAIGPRGPWIRLFLQMAYSKKLGSGFAVFGGVQ